MAVQRRRRPAAKAGPAPSTRVHAVHDLEQWATLAAKAEAAGRLLVVQFYQVMGLVGWFGRVGVIQEEHD